MAHFYILEKDGYVQKFNEYIQVLQYFRNSDCCCSRKISISLVGNSFNETTMMPEERYKLMNTESGIKRRFRYIVYVRVNVKYIVWSPEYGTIQNYKIREDMADYKTYPTPKREKPWRRYLMGSKRSHWNGFKSGSNVNERRRNLQDYDDSVEYSFKIRNRKIDPWDESLRSDLVTGGSWKSKKIPRQWMRHKPTHKDCYRENRDSDLGQELLDESSDEDP